MTAAATVDNLVSPSPEECVLRYVLDRWASSQPDEIFAKFYDGSQWSYAECRARAQRVSGALYRLGVRQGDNVVVCLPNGPAALESWFGINYLGGVFVPVNTAYRGGILQHILDLAAASVAIIHADLLPRLADIEIRHLKTVVVIGGPVTGSYPGVTLIDESILCDSCEPAPLERAIQPWDSIYVMFTSGTTGPSKAVLSSYIHAYGFSRYGAWPIYGHDERHLVLLPVFHVGGANGIFTQLTLGGSIAVYESFKTREFWNIVRESEATTAVGLGIMASFLLKEPPSDRDTDHGLRTVLCAPVSQDTIDFGERFGVNICAVFSMSEACAVISTGLNPTKMGSSGRPIPGFDVRIVDDNDFEVPVGEVGELVVRSDQPWRLMTEYYGNLEATARAWRNGWFHTGDLLRRDSDGDYFFVDRKKDAIRRRGENISSLEVECEILRHPSVREAAVYPAKSELSEDEVMVAISLVENHELKLEDLIEFLIPRMAYFMIPRYVRVLAEVPKTSTGKIAKNGLREEGVTPDTWDREAVGIIIKRDRIRTVTAA